MALDLDESLDFDRFHDYLYEKDITIYPGVIPESKTFRVSVIGDLNSDDMNYVIETVGAYFN